MEFIPDTLHGEIYPYALENETDPVNIEKLEIDPLLSAQQLHLQQNGAPSQYLLVGLEEVEWSGRSPDLDSLNLLL